MNELALFAGAGGGLLASRLLGWRTRCAVELDSYARRVLLARQRDGCLDRFPIWDDVKTFDGRPWRGAVDVISGGFPCQAHSTAARGRNNAPDLWPEMLRIVSEVEPRFVFAENVQRKPIRRAAEDLLALGYQRASIARVGASSVGAPHDRTRWWLLADANREVERLRSVDAKMARLRDAATTLWTEPGSEVLGMDDGLAGRMVRRRAIGNGQVPRVASLAWHILRGLI